MFFVTMEKCIKILLAKKNPHKQLHKHMSDTRMLLSEVWYYSDDPPFD